MNHIVRQMQTHRLRHVIKQLVGYLPEEMRASEVVRELASYGCLTRMHVVQLLAPRVDNEDHTKDVDFSPGGIGRRWEAGYTSACRAIEQAPWQREFGPHDGVILHELQGVGRLSQSRDYLNAVTQPGSVETAHEVSVSRRSFLPRVIHK